MNRKLFSPVSISGEGLPQGWRPLVLKHRHYAHNRMVMRNRLIGTVDKISAVVALRRYNAYVDFGPETSQRLGLAAVLLLSGLGLLAGIGTSSGPLGYWGYSVTAARYLASRDLPKKSRLPRLPRGIFLALLFALVPFLKGWCSVFLQRHVYFIFVYAFCGISAAAWLLIALFLQSASEKDISPVWLKHWYWANVAGFLLLMAIVGSSLATLSASSGG